MLEHMMRRGGRRSGADQRVIPRCCVRAAWIMSRREDASTEARERADRFERDREHLILRYVLRNITGWSLCPYANGGEINIFDDACVLLCFHFCFVMHFLDATEQADEIIILQPCNNRFHAENYDPSLPRATLPMARSIAY